MPSESKSGVLVVASEGGVRLSEVRAFLTAIENAYNGALLFQRTLDALPRLERDLFRPLRHAPFLGFWPLIPIAGKRGQPALLTRSSIASLVGRHQSLVLQSVRLESPGDWSFLGIPDSLEVLRKYLNDRHERKKDKVRGPKEEERLSLENDILRTRALRKRIGLARELGATDEDLAPLLEQLLYGPLDELARFQDTGLVTDVKLLEPESEEE